MIRWQVFDADLALRLAARDKIAQAAATAIQDRGVFRIVLAGGTTPRVVYESLSNLRTDWSRWQVYFGDERVLPAEHPERNSKMAHEAWLAQVSIPAAQIFAMPTEHGLRAACDDYADLMTRTPDFDLVLLGLGEDGHTASLFPAHDWGVAPDAPDVLTIHDAPKPPPERISLSANRLSRTQQVLFLVTGAGKQAAVTRWKRGEAIAAASIHCVNGIDVLIDAAAWQA